MLEKPKILMLFFFGKIGWKFFIQLEIRWVRLVKAMYLTNNTNNFLKVNTSPSTSNAWKDILNQRNLLKSSCLDSWERENINFGMIIGWMNFLYNKIDQHGRIYQQSGKL